MPEASTEDDTKGPHNTLKAARSLGKYGRPGYREPPPKLLAHRRAKLEGFLR